MVLALGQPLRGITAEVEQVQGRPADSVTAVFGWPDLDGR